MKPKASVGRAHRGAHIGRLYVELAHDVKATAHVFGMQIGLIIVVSEK